MYPFSPQARCVSGPTEGIVTRNGSGRLTIVDTAGRARNIIRRTRDTQASVTYLAHIHIHSYTHTRGPAQAHTPRKPSCIYQLVYLSKIIRSCLSTFVELFDISFIIKLIPTIKYLHQILSTNSPPTIVQAYLCKLKLRVQKENCAKISSLYVASAPVCCKLCALPVLFQRDNQIITA